MHHKQHKPKSRRNWLGKPQKRVGSKRADRRRPVALKAYAAAREQGLTLARY